MTPALSPPSGSLAPEDQSFAKVTAPNIPEWPIKEKLDYEKELLGFYVSGHPIAEFQEQVDTFQSDDLSELNGLPQNTTVRVGGFLSHVVQKFTKNDNKPWVILTLETREITMECLVFNEAYQKTLQEFPDVFTPNTVVLVEGEVSRRDEDEPLKLIGQRVIPISAAPDMFTSSLHLRLHEKDMTAEKLAEIKQLVKENPGETPLVFCMICNSGDVVFSGSDDLHINNTAVFRDAAARLLSADGIHFKSDHKRPESSRKRRWVPRD